MLESAKHDHLTKLDGISQLQAQMTFRFSVLAKLLDRQMAAIARDHDLSLIGYRALVTIDAFGSVSAADLCRYTAYDKAAVSRVLTELQSARLIEIHADPKHRRRKLLTITALGLDRINAARPAVDARRAALSAALSPEDEAIFLRVIDRLAAHVDQTLATPEKD